MAAVVNIKVNFLYKCFFYDTGEEKKIKMAFHFLLRRMATSTVLDHVPERTEDSQQRVISACLQIRAITCN